MKLAKELRIGNWIEKNGKAYQITAIGIFCVGKEHKPIILTEEWLIKFGFTKFTKEWKGTMKTVWLISEADGIGLCHNPIDNDYETWLLNCDYELKFMPRWLKYVHTLENFYFANRSEELTIK